MNPFWSVSLFWIVSVLFVAIALVLVLRPLLRKKAGPDKMGRRDINIAVYRDQLKEMEADRANGLLAEDQFHAAKVELEQRLAEDAMVADATSTPASAGSRLLGYGLAALVPVAAFAIYFWLGNPSALMDTATAQSDGQMAGGAGQPQGHDMAKLAQQMEAKVQANPEDGKAWVMLAKVYTALERSPDAVKAYQQAVKLLPNDASVLSGYAEALAILHGRKLAGEPMELVHKALALDPNDMKGLELSAIAAFQHKDYKGASAQFGRLLAQLPPNAPYTQEIQSAKNEADRLAGGGQPALDNLSEQPAPASQAAASGATISGKLQLAPALKGKVSPDETVFVFASPGRGAGGPPLAAIKVRAGDLPFDFTLDDSMAMAPGMALSNQKVVMLTARVSKSGQPMPQSGDLEGSIASVRVGAKGVKLVIDRVRP
jgi:cytochrome c-type biogenesis protein CcmH